MSTPVLGHNGAGTGNGEPDYDALCTKIYPNADIDNEYWSECSAASYKCVDDDPDDAGADDDATQYQYNTNNLEMGLENLAQEDGNYRLKFRIRCKYADPPSPPTDIVVYIVKADHTELHSETVTCTAEYATHDSEWSEPISLTAIELDNMEIWLDPEESEYPYVSAVEVRVYP